MNLLKTITRKITGIATNISAVGLVITAACLFLQVLLRELNVTAMWANEFARYGFMVTVFYGFAAVTDKGTHLVITLVQDKMRPCLRLAFLALMKLLCAVLFAVLSYGMLLAAKNAATNNQTFEAFTSLNISIIYYIVLVGYLLSVLNAFLSSVLDFVRFAKGESA